MATPFSPKAALLLGGTWTDITAYVYQRDPVTITRGRPDEASQVNPAAAVMTWNNRDGRFSPLNPAGAYYGSLARNTPLRLSMADPGVYLRIEDDTTSYVSAPDSAGLSITGSIDIRIDVQLTQYWSSVLASKYDTAGNQRSWYLLSNSDGTVTFGWTTDGTAGTFARAATTVPVPYYGRFVFRVTLDATTGNVTFYTAPGGSATWTQLGAVVTGTGATSIFDSTVVVRVGYNPVIGTAVQGRIYTFSMLSGIAGTAKASPDFTAQTPGASSFADAQSNTWTMHGTAELSNRDYRFHGEMSSLPPRWDETGADVYVPATAGGLLRRLGQGQGNAVLQSAIYRAYVRLSSSLAPVAYWPCDDDSGATSLASALGGPPMLFTGSPALASDSSFACSGALPNLNGSSWGGTVPAFSGTWTDNVIRFLMKVPAAGDTNGAVICRVSTAGKVATLDLAYGTGGTLNLTGYDSGGATLFTTGSVAFAVNGLPLRVSMALRTSGSDVEYEVQTLVPGATSGSATSGTLSTAAIGAVTKVGFDHEVAAGSHLASTVIGQVSVQAVWDSLFDLTGALGAWAGETAGNRFHRLCIEEGIDGRLVGPADDSVAMGPQSAQSLPDLLQECETADQGYLFEPRASLGLGYRSRSSMLNQAAACVLSYTGADLFGQVEPEYDDQRTLNDVTASNADGSSSRQVQATGSLNVQAPPAGVGRYDTQADVNLASDGDLDDAAGWRLHLGTTDEYRYPLIQVEMARTEVAGQFAAIQGVNLGDRLQVSSPPAWLPPGSIDQLAAGTTETAGPFTWLLGWNGVPASPYDVAVADETTFGRADTDGSTLHSNIASGATSMSGDTTTSGSPLWSTSAGNYPVAILMAGEEITVTAVSGSSSPQTFTITRSVNGVVKAQTSGTSFALFRPPIISL